MGRRREEQQRRAGESPRRGAGGEERSKDHHAGDWAPQRRLRIAEAIGGDKREERMCRLRQKFVDFKDPWVATLSAR